MQEADEEEEEGGKEAAATPPPEPVDGDPAGTELAADGVFFFNDIGICMSIVGSRWTPFTIPRNPTLEVVDTVLLSVNGKAILYWPVSTIVACTVHSHE